MHPERAKRWLRLLAWLCLLQFALLVVLTAVWRTNSEPLPRRGAKRYDQTRPEPFFIGNPGPWGELEYARINVEPPGDFVPTGAEFFDQTTWLFPGFSRGQLTTFLSATDLTPQQRAELSNLAAWNETADGLVVTPSPNLVLGLTPQARRQIYAVLARSELNPRQFQPYAYRQGGFEDWFGNSGLSSNTLAWLSRLVYPRGSAICFSDLPELLPHLATSTERQELLKALWRNPTILMRLRVRPDADVAALASYWGRGWHVKDIRALLASVAKVPGGLRIDVAHLLPPFARRRLNSYPNPASYSPEQSSDCYWTAFNFFKDPPDDRFHERAMWQQELESNYTAAPTPTFGDILILRTATGEPIHAAAYIADGVVFTKNGDDFRQPWMLMKMEDLLAYYHLKDDESIQAVFFRAKQYAD